MDTQFTDLSVPFLNTEYYCSPSIISKGFTHLMKLVLCVSKFPKSVDMIKHILDKNPEEIDKINEKGWTALMLACRNNGTHSSLEIVKLLIDAGCDVNIRDMYGFSTLMSALCCSDVPNFEIAKMLLDAGFNIDSQDTKGRTALMLAVAECGCYNSSIETVNFLIDAKSNIDLQDIEGWTALMFAIYYCYNSYIKIIKLLLDVGCNIDLRNNKGWSALMMLCKHCNLYSNMKAVKLMLDAGSNTDLQDNNGTTALMRAIGSGGIGSNVDLLTELIIKSQNSITLMDKHNKTAYDYYIDNKLDCLDDYLTSVLKGTIRVSNTKSARNKL